MLNIGYFGDGPWAHNSFLKIVNDNSLNISFVTVRYDNRDDILIKMAKERNIPVELSENINSDEFLQRIEKYNVDIFISMSFNQIFKEKTINTPRLKTINCHAGKLPYYRGRNILNWVLINDEKEFGITVHYVDKGIDTGDIILQRVYPINDEDSYKTLLDRAYVNCADILYDAIKLIQNNNVNVIEQKSIDGIGMYCGKRGIGDEIIDWNLPSRRIFNFVRAICKPGPMATSSINGKIIKINKVREVKGAKQYINNVGQVIGKTEEGFYVKTGDTFIEVLEYEYNGVVKIGDRLI